jgi:hypothetical protein
MCFKLVLLRSPVNTAVNHRVHKRLGISWPALRAVLSALGVLSSNRLPSSPTTVERLVTKSFLKVVDGTEVLSGHPEWLTDRTTATLCPSHAAGKEVNRRVGGYVWFCSLNPVTCVARHGWVSGDSEYAYVMESRGSCRWFPSSVPGTQSLIVSQCTRSPLGPCRVARSAANSFTFTWRYFY